MTRLRHICISKHVGDSGSPSFVTDALIMSTRRLAPRRFVPWTIQLSLLIQLKLSTIVWMFLTTHVTVCVCHAELKGYLITYLPVAERP